MIEASPPRRGYGKFVLSGGVLGAVLAAAGAYNNAAEAGTTLTLAELGASTSLGALVGVLAGAVYGSTRGIRSRGRGGYVLSWALSVGIAAIAVVIPQAIQERAWGYLLIAALLGGGSGMGLAVFALQLRGEK